MSRAWLKIWSNILTKLGIVDPTEREKWIENEGYQSQKSKQKP